MKLKIISFVLFFVALTALAESKQYDRVQWVDLMPQEDMNALYNPPEELFNIPEGSPDDNIANQVTETLLQASNDAYQKALTSTMVIESLNNKKIIIPGFVVPVTIEGDKTTEFFIVPYFGACIHYPPPPPNQTIFATYKPGISLEKIYEAYDFSGLLTTSIKENELATAAYHLEVNSFKVYEG